MITATVEKKEKTGEFYQTPASALPTFRAGSTVPLQIVRTEEFDNGSSENTIILPTTTVIGEKLLVLGKGLDIEDKGQFLLIRNSAYFFRLFVVFFLACVVLLFLWVKEFTANRRPLVHQKETKIFYATAPKDDSELDLDKLDKVLDNNKDLNFEESAKPVHKLPLQSMKVYASTDNVIPEVKEDEAKALRILSEAIELRKSASESGDRVALDQARWRLHAILMQGKVNNFRRRLATYNLWVIYACDLKWKPAAKKIHKILQRYNRSAKGGKTFKPVCP